ncbi:hypothetical protein J45TS6_25230 [Paenibacillus sp. J45TS6]|uniref:Uncharacterized protein n=1 Tax=Paenibacillus gallinarum TaxID=2762232 RepID=A0ABR8T654_9BACL|nr:MULTISPECIES: hypothetical protein [Paenibacillus]MBD7971074.1 hypothetical protein [Paenibacillus gallinarum]GIP44064.1 hypothetical protein J45TS6_25230 [Paenibacillus sp. J45TS6]
MFNLFKKSKKNDDCCSVKIEEVKEEKQSCCNIKIEEVKDEKDTDLSSDSCCKTTPSSSN